MRLFYLSSSTIPSRLANAVHVMKMGQALRKAGHDVTVYALSPQESSPVENLYVLYGVSTPFSIRFIRRLGFGPLWNLFYGLQIIKDIRANPPDIVYGRHLYGLIMCAWAFPAIPVVYEAHAMPGNLLRQLAEGLLFRFKNFRRHVVISAALDVDYLTLYPGLAGKTLVAHDGADPLPEKKAQLAATAGHCHIGYVGHLYPGRGIDIIIGMARELPECNFHIIGGMSADVEYWKQQPDIPKNIIFYGHLPQNEAVSYLNAFDFLLAPYQRKVWVTNKGGDTSRWMSPLKIFEYMSSGRPLICSDMPVLREILRDQENCILCPPEDISAWVAAVKDLAGNPEKARHIAAAAKDDFLRHYTWQSRAEKVIDGLSNPSPSPRS